MICGGLIQVFRYISNVIRLSGGVWTFFGKYHHNVVLMLGEFEYLLITAAANLAENAYGAAIRERIEATTGQKCSIGALYRTIERLEKKGLLTTWMGDATPQRGGRAKRMVRVTAKGAREAKGFYDAVASVSRGASWVTNRTRSAP